MTPPARIAAGLIVVMADVRLPDLDVIPDPVGWLLVLTGVVPLAARERWFRAAVVAAVVGGIGSLPSLVTEPEGWPVVVDALASTVLVFATCTGVMRLVGDDPAATTANRIRWADLLLMAAVSGLALLITAGRAEGVGAVIVPLAIALLGVAIWFVVFLFRVGRHPGLSVAEPALT